MKKTTLLKWHNLLIALFLLTSTFVGAQCIRTSQFGNVVSNNSGVAQTVTTCAYSSAEYSTVSGLILGGNYTFTAKTGSTAGSGTDIFLTITDASNNVIQFGMSPQTVTGISVSSVRLHYADDSSCAGVSSCRNSQVLYLATCPSPTTLVSSNITTSSADISWTEPSSLPANGYDYYYSTTNTAPTSTSTPNGSVAAGVVTASLSGLSSGTLYYYWLRANCGSEASVWTGSANFTTLCTSFTPSYTQAFDTFVPSCWSRSDAGDVTTGPTGTGNGIWVADGFLNVGTTGAARVNLYTTGRTGWLISPTFNLTSGGYRLKFDYGVTAYATTTPSAMGSDDSVELVMSEDGGTTWTSLSLFDTGSNISNTNNSFIYDLTSHVSPNTLFALIANDGTVDDTEDYDFFIDNFIVEAIPSCDTPNNVLATGVTYNSANITWVAPTVAPLGYEYVLDSVATDPSTSGTNINAINYFASLLSPTITYYFHIRSMCAVGVYSNWVTVPFTTPATPPANDDCTGAIALTLGSVFADQVQSGTIIAATTTAGITPSCQSLFAADVWYSLVVPASGSVTIETQVDSTNSMSDSVVAAFSGSCGSLTEIGCDDDGGPTGVNNYMSILSLSALNPGDTIYVGVWKYAIAAPTSTNSQFKISAYDASLSNTIFGNENFSFYPNPVKDVLNISNAIAITKIQVINLLGQEMIIKSINDINGQVDMSQLSAGTYLVKVTSDNQVKTIKVIKE